MRAISSISFSGQLEDKIDAAARAGFAGIEIFREDIIGFEGTPEQIGAYAASAGVAIVSLQSLRDVEGLSGEARAQAFARAARFMDLACRIGAPMLVLCATTDPEARKATQLDDLRELADLAQARGLKLGFEALGSSTHIRSVKAAHEMVQAVARRNFGLVLGAVHLFAAEEGMAVLDAIAPEELMLVHLADAPLAKLDAGLLTRSLRLFPGQGSLPVAALYSALTARGYQGPISLEIFNDQIRALPPAQIAEDGMRAFHLLEDEATGQRATLKRAGLVEFAARPEEAREFEALLLAMGFAPTHRHGAITLWHQGEIWLALNCEEAGLAHSVYLLQGLSVSALGLELSDLPPAPQGRFHGEPSFHGEPVAGESPYGLAVMRGPGGGAFYLQEAPFSPPAQFLPTGAQPATHLRHIDHAAQALQPNLFLSGVLFYRALFDLRSEEIRDVLDPHGTVHSRTLANESKAFRLSLNASFGAGTTTQRFLEKSGFVPFHHIAFACDDLLAFAATLPAGTALTPPANYYEDLALRFDLAPARLAALKAANLFYDCDAGGEYLHLYTRAINGFFFEVVERRGYGGMGAPNAPVRMLAQLRELEQGDALQLM